MQLIYSFIASQQNSVVVLQIHLIYVKSVTDYLIMMNGSILIRDKGFNLKWWGDTRIGLNTGIGIFFN